MKKIVLVGGYVSGPDIALDLARHSERVPKPTILLASHNPFLLAKQTMCGGTIVTKPDVIEIVGPRAVRFADGQVENDVDALIVCTGFQYYFPFLLNEDGLALKLDDNRLTPLYKHIVHIEHPQVLFLGMPSFGPGLAVIGEEARYAVQVLKGAFTLPSREKMLAWEEQDYRTKLDVIKWPHRHVHKLGPEFSRAYLQTLAEEGGCAPITPSFPFERLIAEIRVNPEGFRAIDYRNYDLSSTKNKLNENN